MADTIIGSGIQNLDTILRLKGGIYPLLDGFVRRTTNTKNSFPVWALVTYASGFVYCGKIYEGFNYWIVTETHPEDDYTLQPYWEAISHSTTPRGGSYVVKNGALGFMSVE